MYVIRYHSQPRGSRHQSWFQIIDPLNEEALCQRPERDAKTVIPTGRDPISVNGKTYWLPKHGSLTLLELEQKLAKFWKRVQVEYLHEVKQQNFHFSKQIQSHTWGESVIPYTLSRGSLFHGNFWYNRIGSPKNSFIPFFIEWGQSGGTDEFCCTV